MQKIGHIISDCALILILVLFDKYTKNLAVIHLKNQPSFPIIDKVFELYYLENRGAAFGIFQNKQIVFIIVSLIFLIIVAYTLIKLPVAKRYYLLEITLAFLAAGAIGNLIDRSTQNYVVDFFYFRLINFPVFNVADIYVSVSCIVLAIILIFVFKEDDLSFLSLKKNNKQDNNEEL